MPGVQPAPSSSLTQPRSQPVRDGRPQHIGCACGRHHTDMAEWWSQDCRRGECRRKRFGRARRDDPVSTRYHDEGRSAESLDTHQPAGDPPQASAGFVVAVPGTRATARHLDSQRHSVVDPVLEGDKAACVAAFGIKSCEPDEFAFCREGIEDKEQRLNCLDRYTPGWAAEVSEVIGSED